MCQAQLYLKLGGYISPQRTDLLLYIGNSAGIFPTVKLFLSHDWPVWPKLSAWAVVNLNY